MTSIIKPGYDDNRKVLADLIPIRTPFSIIITPSTACVFKCKYCPHSLTENELNKGKFIKKNMKWETFVKITEQIQEFDDKLKAIHFQGMGEPLINKNFSKMVAYVKKRNIADKLIVITNGALLNQEYSLSLIEAGIDVIKISLQGMSSAKYYEICGVKIDFENLVNNINFLYKNKKQCQVYVKIADISLDEGDEERFYSTFREITDCMFIERIRPTYSGLDFSKIDIDSDKSMSMYGEEHTGYKVCSLVFYMMYLTPDGDVFPCCNYIDPAGWGDINNSTLKKIWESEKRRKFLRMMLSKKRKIQHDYPVCLDCNNPDSCLRSEDELDSCANTLITLF